MIQSVSPEIEVLEPLVLMSASCMDAEPVDAFNDGVDVVDAGTESGSVFADLAEDQGEQTSEVVECGVNNIPTFWGGDRADFVVESQGYGIVSVRCGQQIEFVSDCEEIEFRDGRFKVTDLICETPGSADVGGSEPTESPEQLPNDETVGSGPVIPFAAVGTGVSIDVLEAEDVGEAATSEPVELPAEDVWFNDDVGEDQDDEGNDEDPSGSGKSGSGKSGSGSDLAAQKPQRDILTKNVFTARAGAAVWGSVTGGDGGCVLKSQPEKGYVVLNEDGTFDYVAREGASGDDVFQYTATDADGNSSVGEICITIERGDAPVSTLPVDSSPEDQLQPRFQQTVERSAVSPEPV